MTEDDQAGKDAPQDVHASKYTIRYLNAWGVECVIKGVRLVSMEPTP